MRRQRELRCSYAVGIGSIADQELTELAAYLSALSVHGCDVIVFDDSPREEFARHATVLRWVGRHLPVGDEERSRTGSLDLVRAAISRARCENVILAGPEMRWSPRTVDDACELLARHEAVEPRDFVDPLPWWGGIDAGRILLERGIDPDLDRSGSVALRRSAIRPLRALIVQEHPAGTARRLAGIGAEVYAPPALSVGRRPGSLPDWVRRRPAAAAEEFRAPFRSALFLSLLPLLLFFALAGGVASALLCATAIGAISLGLALRGRLVAGRSFPLRAILFAPLAVLERSFSVYWALALKMAGNRLEERVASSESAGVARRANLR